MAKPHRARAVIVNSRQERGLHVWGLNDIKPSTSVVVSQYAVASFQPKERTHSPSGIRLERFIRHTLVGFTTVVALQILINQGKAGLHTRPASEIRAYPGAVTSFRSIAVMIRL